MIKLESFMRDGKIPSYSQVWRSALAKLSSHIDSNKDCDYPPADDSGDYFNAALDNVVWLQDMAGGGDELDEDEYRQWWVDFIISITSPADASQMKYPEGGCDGEIRFDFVVDDDNLLG